MCRFSTIETRLESSISMPHRFQSWSHLRICSAISSSNPGVRLICFIDSIPLSEMALSLDTYRDITFSMVTVLPSSSLIENSWAMYPGRSISSALTATFLPSINTLVRAASAILTCDWLVSATRWIVSSLTV